MFLLLPSHSAQIKAYAKSIGFAALGITTAQEPKNYSNYLGWLEKQYHGEMWYLSETSRKEKRKDPRLLLPTVKSILVGAVSYKPKDDSIQKNSNTKIARYAWGLDYHLVMKEKFVMLSDWLTQQFGAHESKICVDTAPVLERDFAEQSGIGWIGKNTLLINQKYGSYVYLGELFTSLDFPKDLASTFHCGTCTRCLDACPTQAFEAPFILNANKCISYHTIENRSETLPQEMTSNNQEWLAGCDICQEVCPWNRKSPTLSLEELEPQKHMKKTSEELSLMSQQELKTLFKDSSLSRIKPAQMQRNIQSLKK